MFLEGTLVMWIGQLLPLHHLCVYGRSWRTLFGIYNGTPFFKKARAVSGCPYVEAMCINVFPSLVRADRDGRYLSSNMSTIWVWPLSAAICTALRSCCKGKYRIRIIHALLQNRTERFTTHNYTIYNTTNTQSNKERPRNMVNLTAHRVLMSIQ